MVPIAVSGSEHARRGWRIRPVKVHLRFGAPLTFPRVESPSPFLAGEVTERIWPCVELQWEWLGGLPPLRTAAVVGAGSMGTAAAVVLARAGLEVQLGCRTSEQADLLRAEGENAAYLPGVQLRRRDRAARRARRGVRRGGPRGARGALQRAARGRRRDRRPGGRAQRRARGLEGPRAAARHHAVGLRGRARQGARGGLAGRSRARARGDRAGRVGGARHPQRATCSVSWARCWRRAA